jgi:hypothetical protein
MMHNKGYGFGMNHGFGMGFGHGFHGCCCGCNFCGKSEMSKEDKVEMLKGMKKMLEEKVNYIEEALKEVEKKGEED